MSSRGRLQAKNDLAFCTVLGLRLGIEWDPEQTRYDGRHIGNLLAGVTDSGKWLNASQQLLRWIAGVDDEPDAQARVDEAARVLNNILTLAGSAYAVGPDHETLIFRVDEAAQLAAEKAIEPEDQVSVDILDAWHAAFGRKPDAAKAWNSAIKAVEEAIIPIMWPSRNAGSTLTLGNAAGELRRNPRKWKTGTTQSSPEDHCRDALGDARRNEV